jgi:hypothetical protein
MVRAIKNQRQILALLARSDFLISPENEMALFDCSDR